MSELSQDPSGPTFSQELESQIREAFTCGITKAKVAEALYQSFIEPNNGNSAIDQALNTVSLSMILHMASNSKQE